MTISAIMEQTTQTTIDNINVQIDQLMGTETHTQYNAAVAELAVWGLETLDQEGTEPDAHARALDKRNLDLLGDNSEVLLGLFKELHGLKLQLAKNRLQLKTMPNRTRIFNMVQYLPRKPMVLATTHLNVLFQVGATDNININSVVMNARIALIPLATTATHLISIIIFDNHIVGLIQQGIDGIDFSYTVYNAYHFTEMRQLVYPTDIPATYKKIYLSDSDWLDLVPADPEWIDKLDTALTDAITNQ